MKKWKILLADDDPEDRAIIQDAMDDIKAGNIIRFAENGEHALDILSTEFEVVGSPCLIVLDLNMPRKNGTETLRHLKSDPRFSAIPVIIFSTSVNMREREKCMSLGAHSYITKPISYKECMDTAHAFLKFCESAS
jgi:CheY-like chemotaxis protein